MIQFLQPWFLVAMGALAVPLILHLMQRQIPRRIIFPSIRFILKGRDAEHGKRGLRDILTMLARMLILALIVLLFARPGLWHTPGGSKSDGSAEIVVFVDYSASMSAGDFEAFIDSSIETLKADFPEASFAAIGSSDHPLFQLEIGTDLDAIRAEIKDIQPKPVQGRHDEAIAAVPGLFTTASGVDRMVAILSDFQASDWGSVELKPLSAIAELRYFRPQRKELRNLAIVDVSQEQFSKGGERRLEIVARVRNYSLADATVKLQLSAGSKSDEKEVTVGGESTESFHLVLQGPEADKAEVKILDDDGYTLDNALSFWIGPVPPIRVGIVIGKSSNARLEAFFLRNALTVKQRGYDSFEVKVDDSSFFLKERLADYQTIFLLDAFRDQPDFQLELARDWVKAGGDLVFFAGANTSNGLPLMNKVGLSKTRFVGFRGELNQLRSFNIATVREDTRLLSPFEREPSDLQVLPIYRFANYEPARNAVPLLELSSGDPFLLQEALESGNVYLFAIGLQPEWSDFPTSQSFLPLVRRIVELSPKAGSHGVVKYTIGDPIRTLQNRIAVPDNTTLETPGVELIDGTSVEVNITRAESDFTPVEQFTLTEAGTASAPRTGDTRAQQHATFFTRELAWLLLALLVVELLLANARITTRKKEEAAHES